MTVIKKDKDTRKLVWNNDGSDLLSPAYGGGAWPRPLGSAEQYIESLHKSIEGTKVDSIFYNGHTNEPVWEVAEREDRVSENIKALGPAPEKHVVEFAHKNNMEFFYSIRMNDIHASYFTPQLSYWPPFRQAHPELFLGYTNKEEFEEKFLPWINKYLEIDKNKVLKGVKYSYEKELELRNSSRSEHPLADVASRVGRPSRDLWSWASYNYACKEVRNRYLAVIEGACNRFDLDGIELDWCRMAMFFKEGEERKNIPLMNDFINQVHLCLKKYSEKRGKPIRLAMRLPDSIEKCNLAGLDPVKWAKEGWMDLIMAGTGLMPFSMPIEEWVSLGRKYDIPVYGCLDRILAIFGSGKPKFDNRDPDIEYDDPSNYDAVRAAACRFWERGVDGIYLYDWHTHHGPTSPNDYGFLPDVHDNTCLLGKDKLYQIDYQYMVGAHIPACIPGQLPLAFLAEAGESEVELKIDLVDTNDVSRCLLIVKWNKEHDFAAASFKFNDVPAVNPRKTQDIKGVSSLISSIDKQGWLAYDIPIAAIRNGQNIISLVVSKDMGEAVLEQVRIWTGYGSDY